MFRVLQCFGGLSRKLIWRIGAFCVVNAIFAAEKSAEIESCPHAMQTVVYAAAVQPPVVLGYTHTKGRGQKFVIAPSQAFLAQCTDRVISLAQEHLADNVSEAALHALMPDNADILNHPIQMQRGFVLLQEDSDGYSTWNVDAQAAKKKHCVVFDNVVDTGEVLAQIVHKLVETNAGASPHFILATAICTQGRLVKMPVVLEKKLAVLTADFKKPLLERVRMHLMLKHLDEYMAVLKGAGKEKLRQVFQDACQDPSKSVSSILKHTHYRQYINRKYLDGANVILGTNIQHFCMLSLCSQKEADMARVALHYTSINPHKKGVVVPPIESVRYREGYQMILEPALLFIHKNGETYFYDAPIAQLRYANECVAEKYKDYDRWYDAPVLRIEQDAKGRYSYSDIVEQCQWSGKLKSVQHIGVIVPIWDTLKAADILVRQQTVDDMMDALCSQIRAKNPRVCVVFILRTPDFRLCPVGEQVAYAGKKKGIRQFQRFNEMDPQTGQGILRVGLDAQALLLPTPFE